MTTVFHGDVLLPGETGSGLAASLELEDDQMTLATGSEVLATWSSHEANFEASGDGSFLLRLHGEDVYFRPDSPMAFARAVDGARPAHEDADVVSFSAPPETLPSNPDPMPFAPAPVAEHGEAPVSQVEPVVAPATEDPVLDEVLAKLPPAGPRAKPDEGDDLISPMMLKVIGGVATVIIVAALLAVALL